MGMFEQRLADALRDAAMDLAVDDQRIDRAADVVDRDIIDQRHFSRIGIDLDFADMRAIGVARVEHGLVAGGVERPLQIFRQILALGCRARHFENADGVVGAFHGEVAVLEFDIGGGGFEQMLGDAQAFFDNAVGGFLDDDRAEPHAAAGMRAAADRDAIGIAGDEAHGLDRHAEPFGDELREARLVALALRDDADDKLDEAVGRHRDFRFLARHAGRDVDVIADPDAAIFAALSSLRRGAA